MALNNFTNIPANATVPGAPIDAFLLRSLRSNADVVEQKLRAALATPFGPMGGLFPAAGNDNVTIATPITNEHRTFQYNARRITLNDPLTTTAGIPLIWFATDRITLNENIDASGRGAAANTAGNFGGTGGGRAGTAAPNNVFPFTGVNIANGGAGPAAAAGGPGNDLPERWASRIFNYLAAATGGGGGAGGNGGAGGGIVILCAPNITFNGGNVFANGLDGAAGAGGDGDGGGGGGTVILICHETNAVAANITATGGAGHSPGGSNQDGGDGGDGFTRIITFN